MGAVCCQAQDKKEPLLLNNYDDEEDDSEYPYQAEVLYEYLGVDENQLTIKKGETIIIIDASDELNGWALAANDNDEEGYVPAEYIKRIMNKEWRKSEKYRKAQKLMEKYKADKKQETIANNNNNANGNESNIINNDEQQKQAQQDEAKLTEIQDPTSNTESVKKSEDLKE